MEEIMNQLILVNHMVNTCKYHSIYNVLYISGMGNI